MAALQVKTHVVVNQWKCAIHAQSLDLGDMSSVITSGGSTFKNFRRTPPTYGTQFFHFRIHLHRKVPVSEAHAP